MQRKSSSAKFEDGSSYIFLSSLNTITVLEYTVVFLFWLSGPLCHGVSLLYIPLFYFILALHV